jgi:hypothetical protein
VERRHFARPRWLVQKFRGVRTYRVADPASSGSLVVYE